MRGVLGQLLCGNVRVKPELLKKLNLAAGVLLAGQALAILLLSKTYSLPIYIAYLTSDSLQTKLQGIAVTAPAIHEFTQINLANVLAALLFISAVLYLLSATLWRERYEHWLKQGWQPLRWVTITILASGVFLLLALLVGLQDLATIKLLILATLIASLTGAVLERLAAHRHEKNDINDWLLLAVAVLATAAPWLVLLLTMVSSSVFGNVATPGYVWGLVGTAFVSVLLMLANAHMNFLHYSAWAKYHFTECCSIVLLTLIETVFAWQFFIALLRP